MNTKGKKPNNREYTLKVIPHQGETVRSYSFSIRTLKLWATFLSICTLLLVLGFGYMSYTVLKEDSEAIKPANKTTANQQAEIAQLAKEAQSLQKEMERLTEREKTLRRMLEDDTEDDAEKHTGQGGPSVAAEVSQVRRTLEIVSRGIPTRRENLARLESKLKEQREEAAAQKDAADKLARTSVPENITDSIANNIYDDIAGNIPSGWPTTGEISSPFGWRWNGTDFHPGIDIANDTGTPLIATADGVVTAAGWNSGGYGNLVDIDHGDGFFTRYAHASEVIVHEGQYVHRGEVIAYMGSTGFSTGPHVHYEIHVQGETVNPSSYL